MEACAEVDENIDEADGIRDNVERHQRIQVEESDVQRQHDEIDEEKHQHHQIPHKFEPNSTQKYQVLKNQSISCITISLFDPLKHR